MDFKIRKDECCGCCGTSNVPLAKFDTEWLCEYCSNSVGHGTTEVYKEMLAQMFHVLERKLSVSGKVKP